MKNRETKRENQQKSWVKNSPDSFEKKIYAAYEQMAQDEKREVAALEWSEDSIEEIAG